LGEGRDKEGSMYFIYLYENRTMKPVEIVFSRGEGNEGE
jgi:hypothetical protein